MSDGDTSSPKPKRTKRLRAKLPSNKGFFIFMSCCALGAITLIALLVSGDIKGARVGPDIEHVKGKDVP